MDWKEWFKENGDKKPLVYDHIGRRQDLGFHESFEEMYQAFKARLIDEVEGYSPELLYPIEIHEIKKD